MFDGSIENVKTYNTEASNAQAIRAAQTKFTPEFRETFPELFEERLTTQKLCLDRNTLFRAERDVVLPLYEDNGNVYSRTIAGAGASDVEVVDMDTFKQFINLNIGMWDVEKVFRGYVAAFTNRQFASMVCKGVVETTNCPNEDITSCSGKKLSVWEKSGITGKDFFFDCSVASKLELYAHVSDTEFVWFRDTKGEATAAEFRPEALAENYWSQFRLIVCVLSFYYKKFAAYLDDKPANKKSSVFEEKFKKSI